MESLLHSHSKHPSYKSILFKYKKRSSFLQRSNSLYCSCSLTKSSQGLNWRNAAFPTYGDPNSWLHPEGRRVGNPRSKERNMLRSTWWWTQGCSEHCFRARRIFLNPGNWDPGGEPACSPLSLGKRKSGTCLSQWPSSLKNKKGKSN